MSRKAFQPTQDQRAQVEAYAAYGIPQADMCKLVINPETGKPLSLKTLEKAFRLELDTGMAKANAKVGESLYMQAVGAPAQFDTAGNQVRAEQPRSAGAAIFWAKARMGWSEKFVHEHSGKNGGPMMFVDAAVLAAMTDEELAKYEANLAQLEQLVGTARSRAGGAGTP